MTPRPEPRRQEAYTEGMPRGQHRRITLKDVERQRRTDAIYRGSFLGGGLLLAALILLLTYAATTAALDGRWAQATTFLAFAHLAIAICLLALVLIRTSPDHGPQPAKPPPAPPNLNPVDPGTPPPTPQHRHHHHPEETGPMAPAVALAIALALAPSPPPAIPLPVPAPGAPPAVTTDAALPMPLVQFDDPGDRMSIDLDTYYGGACYADPTDPAVFGCAGELQAT